MKAFHRTRKESRILGFFGLAVALIISIFFMLIGFDDSQSEAWNPIQLIFGIAGVFIFIVFIRGAWMATGGAVTHVFSIDADELTWGFIGKEKKVRMKDIHSIYWDESDGFDFILNTSNGRIRVPYAQNVIAYKSRPVLLSYLRENYPSIDIDGWIDKKTEQSAAEQSASRRSPLSSTKK